jgi:flagellin-like protein
MKNTQNEEGVSPVIGVILMVAITVILAAVIAAFVFGLVGTMQTTKVVAINAKQVNSTAISVMNMGGQDVGSLTTITVSGDVVGGTVGNAVGNRADFLLSDGAGRKSIIVIGAFSDGSEQVLLDTMFTRT